MILWPMASYVNIFGREKTRTSDPGSDQENGDLVFPSTYVHVFYCPSRVCEVRNQH